MRDMRHRLGTGIGLLLLAGAVLAAPPIFKPAPPKKFAVGVGQPSKNPPRLAASVGGIAGGTLTVARGTTVINADGSQNVQLIYTNANSATVHTRYLYIDSGCTKVTDNLGNTVSASGPGAECTAAGTFTAQEDTTISNAAAGGKLNL